MRPQMGIIEGYYGQPWQWRERAETAAFLLLAAIFFTTSAGRAGVARHDRPVPILMYHVIAAAPSGVAFPDLFVRPADFRGQMGWLAQHGYHAVTLQRVYDYWRDGSPLPPQPIVLSFDDGYLGQHTNALPVLRKLGWPGVLNLKVNALKSRYTLPAWRVHQMLAAGWELDAHTITHPDLTHVDEAQLWREVHGSRTILQREFQGGPIWLTLPGPGRFLSPEALTRSVALDEVIRFEDGAVYRVGAPHGARGPIR